MKTKKSFKKILKSHYDGEAQQWCINLEKEPARYYHTTYFASIFDRNLSGKTALDIGCGAGTFTLELAKHNFKTIYALDFSQPMLDCLKHECKKRNIGNVKTIKGDVEKLPFKDNYFDFIVLVGLMECLAEKKKALKEIYRVLKPGGTASIRWLNKNGIWSKMQPLREFLRTAPSPIPYSNFSKIDYVVSDAKKTGFVVDKIEGMIALPLFLFPPPLSSLLELLLIKTGLAYKIEGTNKSDTSAIKRYYYSFCTKLRKAD